MVMVKPGMPYLDIVRRVKDDVQGADVRLSGERRIRDAEGGIQERLARRTAVRRWRSCSRFKRAGADGMLTYFALDAATWLKQAR